MKRVYVLLDSKLTKSQRIPQAAHAIGELMLYCNPEHGFD